MLKSIWNVLHFGWHAFGDFFRLIIGIWKISRIEGPVVSIFGGSKLQQAHPSAERARVLAEKLMNNGISILTGGGPGIMEAANCGISPKEKRKARSIGVTVHGLATEETNKCADEHINTHYFYTRKFLLSYCSMGFAVFPGGYGTADELFKILTLMQTNKIKRVPVVLINKEYWQPILDWVEIAKEKGLLLQEDADLIFVTTDVDEAFNHLYQGCKK